MISTPTGFAGRQRNSIRDGMLAATAAIPAILSAAAHASRSAIMPPLDMPSA